MIAMTMRFPQQLTAPSGCGIRNPLSRPLAGPGDQFCLFFDRDSALEWLGLEDEPFFGGCGPLCMTQRT